MQTLLQQTAEELVKRASRTYKFKDIISHHSITFKNLPETLGRYPNQGVGFKVWRKTWPSHKFIIIKEADFKTLRNAKFFGLHYAQNKPIESLPTKIRNCGKRGIWRYDTNGANAITENGLIYPAEILKEYMLTHSFSARMETFEKRTASLPPEILQKQTDKSREIRKKARAHSKTPTKKELAKGPVKKAPPKEAKKKDPPKDTKKDASKDKKK